MEPSLDEILAELKEGPISTSISEEKSVEVEELSLKKLRRRLGVTQIEMAQRLGVLQSAIAKIENREDHLLSTVARYVEALGGTLVLQAEFPE